MVKHKEEQEDELQALEAIYSEEITVINSEGNIKFTIDLSNQSSEEEDKSRLRIQFTFPQDYPDQVPEIDVVEYDGEIDENNIKELIKVLNEEANNNLGTVMVYALISKANEWLNTLAENRKKYKLEEVEREKKELEEIEQRKFEGTRVTVENFLAWKKMFDEEMQLTKRDIGKIDIGPRKLTGRELFEKDESLFKSDLEFLDNGDQNFLRLSNQEVKVDESLFQELDDINDLNEDD